MSRNLIAIGVYDPNSGLVAIAGCTDVNRVSEEAGLEITYRFRTTAENNRNVVVYALPDNDSGRNALRYFQENSSCFADSPRVIPEGASGKKGGLIDLIGLLGKGER
jgi:hypothetical protein